MSILLFAGGRRIRLRSAPLMLAGPATARRVPNGPSGGPALISTLGTTAPAANRPNGGKSCRVFADEGVIRLNLWADARGCSAQGEPGWVEGAPLRVGAGSSGRAMVARLRGGPTAQERPHPQLERAGGHTSARVSTAGEPPCEHQGRDCPCQYRDRAGSSRKEPHNPRSSTAVSVSRAASRASSAFSADSARPAAWRHCARDR